MKMKKFFALLLSLSMALSLAACGGADDDDDTDLTDFTPMTVEELTGFLRQAGFLGIKVYGDKKMRAPRPGEQRVFFVARKDKRSKINGR